MTPAEIAAALTARLDGPHSDDGTAAVAELAAEAVRYLNYATAPHAGAGLTYPSTAYAVTGSLALGVSRLGQCLGQVGDFLDLELASGRLGDDSRCHPALPVERARRMLERAAGAASALNDALLAAQGELAGLHQRAGNGAGGRTFTHPDVFTAGVTQGWAEAETDPAQIDWPARQARAAIPFQVVDGRPVNPCERTSVRYGRGEMGFWGEQLMADALVTATCLGARYLLMVEGDDGHGWAVPGGHVEPGETGTTAAVRELAEETGLDVFGTEPFLTLETFHVLPPQYVPDPRASDEAWAVTIPVHIDLGRLAGLPSVTGSDDARRAEWIPADSYHQLTATLSQRHDGQVFAAHTAMLTEFLEA